MFKDAGFGEDDLAGRQETVYGVEEVGVVKDDGLGEDDPGDDHGQTWCSRGCSINSLMIQ